MDQSATAIVITRFIETNTRILAFVEKLLDEQLHWSAGSGQSIAFHLWHIARWIDHFQAALPGMTPVLGERLGPGRQIWQSSGLTQRWQFDSAGLGWGQTGMSMGDEALAQTVFPPKRTLLEYIRQVFATVEHSIQAIDDEQFKMLEQPQPMTEGIWAEDTVGSSLLTHMTHNNRHLGMMECLLGLQGASGSASM